jgi:hypothetical protein
MLNANGSCSCKPLGPSSAARFDLSSNFLVAHFTCAQLDAAKEAADAEIQVLQEQVRALQSRE